MKYLENEAIDKKYFWLKEGEKANENGCGN